MLQGFRVLGRYLNNEILKNVQIPLPSLVVEAQIVAELEAVNGPSGCARKCRPKSTE
jgi:hypothetical protein